MFKVILVDDEALFVEYLHMTINWEMYGFEIACSARDGEEALELVNRYKPDVALIDINMPFMNGLELSRVLKEKFPDMAIVLITGYNEFEYARKAVKVGVDDYILKPFDNEELISTLSKIRERLQNLLNEREFMQANEVLMKERLLNLLIGGEFSFNDEEVIKRLRHFGIHIHSQIFLVSSVEIDGLYEKWADINDIVHCKSDVSGKLNMAIGIKGNYMVFNGPEGRLVSIIEFDDDIEAENFKIDGYERLIKMLKEDMGLTVTLGIGRIVNGFRDLRKSYMESVIALQNKIIAGKGKVIEYASLERDCMNIGYFSSGINEKLSISLHLSDVEGIRKEINEVFLYIRDKKLSVDFTCTIIMGLVSLCLTFITECGKNIEDIFGKSFSPYAEARNKPSLDATKEWVVGLFEKTIKYCTENKLTKSKKIIGTVKQYIEANFNDSNLSVEEIASNIFINSSYLRRVFKKELNMTVCDYITHTRMVKAKEFIDTNNIKISNISEMVGYCDSGYFSKCFKKYYGISPSEYESLKR